MQGNKYMREWLKDQDAQKLSHQKVLEDFELEKSLLEKRAQSRSLFRRLNAERREAETEDAIVRAAESKRIQQAQFEQEEKLARQLDNANKEEQKELKLRQNLRESNYELKDLAAKLRAAYVTKALLTQLKEKEAAKLAEQEIERRAQDILKATWSQDEDAETREMHKRMIGEQYRKDLQDQMIAAEEAKREAYNEFLCEKKLIDDTVRRIHEEDQKDLEEKMLRMEKTKQEIEEFRKAREAWKQKEQEELAEEERRLHEYMAGRNKREEQRMEELQKREERKARIAAEQGFRLLQAEQERREREALIMEIREADAEQVADEKEKAEAERLLRQRLELRASFVRQVAEKIERLQREAAEELAFKDEILRQKAEDDRVEQLTAQAKRLKVLEHRQAVDKLLEERRVKRAEELQLLLVLRAQEEEEEAAKVRLVEEERLRMLQEHATELLGFLPRGVLREDDLPHLGPEYMEWYGRQESSS